VIIDNRQFLNNYDELGLQTSCTMLVWFASLWNDKKCRK